MRPFGDPNRPGVPVRPDEDIRKIDRPVSTTLHLRVLAGAHAQPTQPTFPHRSTSARRCPKSAPAALATPIARETIGRPCGSRPAQARPPVHGTRPRNATCLRRVLLPWSGPAVALPRPQASHRHSPCETLGTAANHPPCRTDPHRLFPLRFVESAKPPDMRPSGSLDRIFSRGSRPAFLPTAWLWDARLHGPCSAQSLAGCEAVSTPRGTAVGSTTESWLGGRRSRDLPARLTRAGPAAAVVRQPAESLPVRACRPEHLVQRRAIFTAVGDATARQMDHPVDERSPRHPMNRNRHRPEPYPCIGRGMIDIVIGINTGSRIVVTLAPKHMQVA